MYPPSLTPPRNPQRVVVAGTPGPQLSAFLAGLSAHLDVPLVPLAELDPAEITRLAAFEGWVTTSEVPDARPVLLERAQLVVRVSNEEPGTLRGLVRRTVRRIRAETTEPDLSWLETLPLSHPSLPMLHLAGPTAIDAWLSGLSG